MCSDMTAFNLSFPAVRQAAGELYPAANADMLDALARLCLDLQHLDTTAARTVFQPVDAGGDEEGGVPISLEQLTGMPPVLYTMKERGHLYVQLTARFADLCDYVRRLADEARADSHEVHCLGIDIETYSSVDLTKAGLYKYVESPDFTVLLFAYSADGAPVQVIDLTREELPAWIVTALYDESVTKTAFNAVFERTCLSRCLNRPIPAEQWECTMVRAAMEGWGLGLDNVARQMGTAAQKMDAGRALIRFFCCPCKGTKANNGRQRNLPEHDAEKWAAFKKYNGMDVETEQAIRASLLYDMPARERELYCLDARINDRGVLVDIDLVRNAIAMNATYKARLIEEATQLTGLDNPNSVAMLKGWLESQTGETVSSLRKGDLPAMMQGASNDTVRRILEIRSEAAKTSNEKYTTMAACCCDDHRMRGLTQFYASRTGRWAGRLVQLQNLPQNHLKDLALAREAVKRGDLGEVELLFGNVPDTLSQLIRTALIAPTGKKLVVCDFSAIEARVLSWLAGERWRLNVFRGDGKIYEATAALLFGVSATDITKTDPRRQKGKIAELALGYGGGVSALDAMGADKMGLSQGEKNELVATWRQHCPRIVDLWYSCESAALRVMDGGSITIARDITFSRANGDTAPLVITLPSDRRLVYQGPSVVLNRFGREAVAYQGLNQTTQRWECIEMYGGKWVENIVQAFARDCLAEVMLRMDKAGHDIVFHVHDEVISEEPDDSAAQALLNIKALFAAPPKWAPDLPLRGDGYVTDYYLKD